MTLRQEILLLLAAWIAACAAGIAAYALLWLRLQVVGT